ncbi:MAG: hypothetical protein AABW72_02460 [archaeon]
MLSRRRINLSQLSRGERHRIKSSRPRRRIAKEAAKRRALTDANIRRTFVGIFPHDREYILKSDSRIIGAGKGRLTISLGTLVDPKTGKSGCFAFKVCRMPDNFVEAHKRHVIFGETHRYKSLFMPDFKSAESFDNHYFLELAALYDFKVEHARFRRIASLRIPTVFSKLVPIDPAQANGILLVEDLSGGGRNKVEEFHKFNHAKVSNALELMTQFEKYYQKLLKAGIKISSEARHGEHSSLREETERSFFVVIDPKTRKGKLVAGDADQIEF